VTPIETMVEESRRVAPTIVWLPDEQPTPCPELLTEAEAIRYLRLDTVKIKDPSAKLRAYRKRRVLRGTQISKRVFYRRTELDAFLDRITVENPR
jgi:hypothetical protein